MCWPCTSAEAFNQQCPMCIVYPPRSASQRCPHAKELCTNRALHPKHDVVYLTTAEVPLWNGCGYCQFARLNPAVIPAHNPGSPGCCRAPNPSEYRLIPALAWTAVATVHQIPIPTEIKQLLSRGGMPGPSFGSRATGNAKGSPTSPRAKGLPLTPKSRPSDVFPSSLPNSSPLDAFETLRRRVDVEKRGSSRSPPTKTLDLESGTPRRTRPPLSTITSAMSGITLQAQQQQSPPPLRRRASSLTNSTPKSSPARAPAPATITLRSQPKRPTLAALDPANIPAPPSINSASSSSGSSEGGGSSGSGSTTDGTVTSDGGFTDYLSDESEAELQRQAEAKAVIVAQTHAEEQEFKAARHRLATVDLRPPRSWNHPAEVLAHTQRPIEAPRSQMEQHIRVYGAPGQTHYGGYVQAQMAAGR